MRGTCLRLRAKGAERCGFGRCFARSCGFHHLFRGVNLQSLIAKPDPIVTIRDLQIRFGRRIIGWPSGLARGFSATAQRRTNMAKDSNVQWSVINTETLPADISAAYKSYKSAYAAMKDARDEFEIALRTALRPSTPKGKRLAIAYNFGKLSVAIVDDDRKSTSAKSAISLADLAKR